MHGIAQHDGDDNDANYQSARKKIYDPKNWRYTDRELGRYAAATVTAMGTCIHSAFAGPDGTKIGTDLGVVMAACINPLTKVTAVCLPQAYIFYFSIV